MNSEKETDLKLIEKILLFLFVSQLFILPEYLREVMINNWGWGNIYPLRLYTIGFPAIYIAVQLWSRDQKFKTPHLRIFIILFSGFILLESLPSREVPGYSFIDLLPFRSLLFPDIEAVKISFALNQFHYYIFFLILVNFGLNRVIFYKIVDYALYAGLITCLLTYMGFWGIISVEGDYLFQEYGFTQQGDSLISLVLIPYMGAFSVLMLIIKQLNEKKVSLFHISRDLLIIIAIFVMILICARRMPFILVTILALYYCYIPWRLGSRAVKFLVLFAVSITAVIYITRDYHAVIFSSELAQDVFLYRRITEYESTIAGNLLRTENLLNAFTNFAHHPFIGVGYQNASITEYRDYFMATRTANQPVLILASCGIFYFMIYLYYNFRFFICTSSLLKRPEVLLSFTFQLFTLLVVSPSSLALISISAYIAFYYYHSTAMERTKEPSG